MDPIAAKYIGAGIACIGMGGAGVGVGTIFGHYLAAAVRNPSAADGQFPRLIFGFGGRGGLAIFSLLSALLRLWGVGGEKGDGGGRTAVGGEGWERLMAKTNAHTGGPGGGREFSPPFQKETFPSQLFWLAI